MFSAKILTNLKMFGISKVNLKMYSTKIYTNLKFMPWIIY